MIRTGSAIWFEGPHRIGIRTHPVPAPGYGELTVQARVSLLSPGTELRIYRGQIANDTELGLETCEGSFPFPVKYGYQVVGEVVATGAGVPLDVGAPVFVRHPHQDLFTLRYHPDLVFRLPESMDAEIAAFSNMMSVAINAHLDFPVRVGDEVAVFGQGPVGLFCTMLAARTAYRVWAIEPSPMRRRLASDLTGAVALHPDQATSAILDATGGAGVDVAFEVSGAPRAMQQALGILGVEATLVVVSYYGDQLVPLRLSPDFHFKRHRIVSSQAGMIGSGLQPRWDRLRRLRTAWTVLGGLTVDQLVSHRFSLEEASEAYRILDEGDDDVYGVVLQHGHWPRDA